MLAADGHCYFEAEALQVNMSLLQKAGFAQQSAAPKKKAAPAPAKLAAAAPAKPAPAAAPAKPAAAAPAAPAAPTNGCQPGEILAADGHCYFEAEALQVNMSLLQKGANPALPVRSNLGPIDASKV